MYAPWSRQGKLKPLTLTTNLNKEVIDMALKQPYLLKTVIGTDVPTLTASPGEAFLVKDILVRDSVASYITIRIAKSTVGYIRTKGPFGSHCAFRRGHAQHSHTIRLSAGSGGYNFNDRLIRDTAGRDREIAVRLHDTITGVIHDEVQALMWSGFQLNETLLSFLGARGIFKGYPIAEGETMTISGMERTDEKSITLIIYEQWEPGDISPDQENGSKAAEYLFFNYGDTGAVVNVDGDSLYDNAVSPAEFPDFPWGKVVPANHEIDLIGICGSPRAPGDNITAHHTYTEFIKLVKDREVLFDEDRNGIIFLHRSPNVDSQIDQTAEGFTLIGNLSEYDNNPPLMFPVPLTFVAGDELNVYLTTVKTGDGREISQTATELALIQKVRRLG
ncbi:hypothetical protein ES702_06760 [subsurface metagenome]